MNLYLSWIAVVGLGLPHHANGQAVLSEIMSDPVGSDHHDEYVELWNTSQQDTLSLDGWRLGDDVSLDLFVDVDNSLIIAPGDRVLVVDASYEASSTTYDSVRELARIVTIEGRSFGRAGWSNSGRQEVLLLDATGAVADRMVYEPSAGRSGHSWERRRSDGIWLLSLRAGGTPGRPNSVDEVAAASGRIDVDVSTDPHSRDLKIHCRLPVAPALLSVRIYDAEGNLIARLRDWDAAGLEEFVRWDGRDLRGLATAPGMYVVSVRASAAGQITQATAAIPRF